MSDHFSDRFWSTRFWATRYFQGGEQAAGSMRATLTGGSSLSANLTYENAAVPILPSGYMPYRLIKDEDQARKVFIRASLSGKAHLRGMPSGQAQLRARIEGVCSVSASPEAKKDFTGVDTFFWFMAA